MPSASCIGRGPRAALFVVESAKDWITDGLRRLPYTAIVKPAWEGSSKGIRGKCVVDDLDECVAAVRRLQTVSAAHPRRGIHRGEELTVGIVGNAPPRIIGILRVVPQRPTNASSTAWKSNAITGARSVTSAPSSAGSARPCGGGGGADRVQGPGLPGCVRVDSACGTASRTSGSQSVAGPEPRVGDIVIDGTDGRLDV